MAGGSPDREMDKRGQARGKRRKRGEGKRGPVEFHFDRPPRGLAGRSNSVSNPLEIRIRAAWPDVTRRNRPLPRFCLSTGVILHATSRAERICPLVLNAAIDVRDHGPLACFSSGRLVHDPIRNAARSPDRIETRARTLLSYSINWLPPIKFWIRSRETFVVSRGSNRRMVFPEQLFRLTRDE